MSIFVKDFSETAIIARKIMIIYFLPTLFSLLIFFIYKNGTINSVRVFVENSYEIIGYYMHFIIPGSITDLNYIEKNRSLDYLNAAKMLYMISFLSFIACYYFNIKEIIRIKFRTGNLLTLSAPLHVIIHLIACVFLLIWRTPNHTGSFMGASYPDENGLYIIKTGIAMSVASYSSSILICNIVVFALNNIKLMISNQNNVRR